MALHAPKRRKLSSDEGSNLSPYVPNPVPPPILHDSFINPENASSLSISDGSVHPKKSFDARFHQINPVNGSSLFRLQLQELLGKVKPFYGSRMKKAEDALKKLKRVIELIPDCEPVTVR